MVHIICVGDLKTMVMIKAVKMTTGMYLLVVSFLRKKSDSHGNIKAINNKTLAVMSKNTFTV
ncbi:hypothetical protein [Metabacillus idriensis]|uniref:hypothetical protein n=1 Tax=Metabacillus idriensis TaxID=324768 RepID=UPI00163AFD24|nr:hypothetical protein [Metabacillus idriensis]QNG61577.1 hypothetical protein H4O14_08920 [Bacillus sp. PAMC26568]